MNALGVVFWLLKIIGAKWAFLLIAILVFISACAGIMGTFLIKPVVNNFIVRAI